MNRLLDQDSQPKSNKISHRPYTSRDELEIENLLNNNNNKSTNKNEKYFKNSLNNKSIWSILSTSIYLYFHKKNLQKWNKFQMISFIIILLLFLIYFVLSFYINIPYWIHHGYIYHFDHFKWSSSLNGTFCNNNLLNVKSNINKILNNNTNFLLTRSRILLLSYPRSGNHLTKSMIECLLESKTYGYPKEKNDGKQQIIALKNANINKPFIRKIHTPNAILKDFNKYKEWGLIYLIRDPIECILSENKWVPTFWKDYEFQFGHEFIKLPLFYKKWNQKNSKIIIFYEDYFNGTHGINLKKLAKFFGNQRVSNDRLNYCINNYHKIIQHGLKALDRTATSNTNLHFYRDKYYGKNCKNIMTVESDLYESVFKRYENIQSC